MRLFTLTMSLFVTLSITSTAMADQQIFWIGSEAAAIIAKMKSAGIKPQTAMQLPAVKDLTALGNVMLAEYADNDNGIAVKKTVGSTVFQDQQFLCSDQAILIVGDSSYGVNTYAGFYSNKTIGYKTQMIKESFSGNGRIILAFENICVQK